MLYRLILIATILIINKQDIFTTGIECDHWSEQRYGLTNIPPTNTTLLQQEHARTDERNLKNINNLVENIIHDEMTKCDPKKKCSKKRKKNNSHKKQRANCLSKVTIDPLIPEMMCIMQQQYQDPLLVNKIITLKLHDVPLRKAIELISKVSDINFIMDSDVDGYVRDFSFHNTSLAAVLKILLDNNLPRLILLKECGSWRIIKQKTALEELKHNAQQSIDIDTISDHITIYHATWNDCFKKRIEKLWLGIIGTQPLKNNYIVFDDESHLIFFRGRKKFVHDFKKALLEIDIRIPQIRIDARVVLACKDFEESIGFEWSGIYDRSATLCQRGFQFAGIGIGEKCATDPKGFEDLLGWSLNFLPECVRKISTIKLPFTFGNKDLCTDRLNIMLNAAESKRELETILKPSLLVKNQECAEILVGQEMPQETRLQETVEGSPTNVTTIGYKDVGMKIKVKPIVSPDQKTIFLDIFVQHSFITKSSVHESRSPQTSKLGSFPYTIMTSRSTNRVMLNDGQTTMIGGLIENTKERLQTGVPWIQEIPVIGWFFKGKQKQIIDKQLLIFITPTLV